MTSLTIGAELPRTHKTTYQRSLVDKAWADDSIHSDVLTRKHGYPGALISAYIITGYISELMMQVFGERWASSGRYKLSFIGTGLQLGGHIICGGTVTGVVPEADGDRVHCDIWIDKADGQRSVVGQASAILVAAR